MAQTLPSKTSPAETADFYRVEASSKLDPERRSALGQFMTPTSIGQFMTSMFGYFGDEVRLLDPGAGIGSLTATVAERLYSSKCPPKFIDVTCFEIEPLLTDYLSATLSGITKKCESNNIDCEYSILDKDYILNYQDKDAQDLLKSSNDHGGNYTHAIMNPPYKKINANSSHRRALRKAGIETSNLYTGFMYLAALQLVDDGEMVAIIPRSFCNGPYFKPFRNQFFSMMALQQIHIFETRNSAFKGDDVLQENIIIHAIKGREPSKVHITTSRSGDFHRDSKAGKFIAEDMTHRVVPYGSVVRSNDLDSFVYIATNELDQAIVDRMAYFTHSLQDLNMKVSTGPVVDFRLREDLCEEPKKGTAPLLYPIHFKESVIEWPKKIKKPNAIKVSNSSKRWLWKNSGFFVITKRFSAKEEKRRIVAIVYDGKLPGKLIGFENHLNVFHINREGISEDAARGLCVYLNSTLVDKYFRQFNGHTQVNATDLRSLPYPSLQTLEHIGKSVGSKPLSQDNIDKLIEEELAKMTDSDNPLEAQRKIDEALEIVKALGMPRGQQNERTALTLLALLDLKPSGKWGDLRKPLMGITPIMDYCRNFYGRNYAPNTRETFRRQSMHQFVEAGIVSHNPDKPDRPVNSPDTCYQINEETYRAILTFGTKKWLATLKAYLGGRKTLVEEWKKDREKEMIPVKLAEGMEIKLTPGAHNELIKEIIMEFAPRFAPDSEVIYIGEAGSKDGYSYLERLSSLGVTLDRHGKMPDVVLYFAKKDWILLVESVTSHGPVDAKRYNELTELFSGARSGLIYVTAFPNRSVMGKYLTEISWETEVWCSDTPTHLIHFNGERFLGPRED